MVYQGNTEDDTDASFRLITACQCQVQLSEDKNTHVKTLHCSTAVSHLPYHGQSPICEERDRF